MNKCACETFSYRTYTARTLLGVELYAGHYHCGAVKALGKLSGTIKIWEGGKVIKAEDYEGGKLLSMEDAPYKRSMQGKWIINE